MGGGIIQLAFYGAQDIYLTGNPSISFFKSVYKTYTNFSLESKRLELNKTLLYFNENTTYICKVLRHADLVTNMYLCIDLPNIYDTAYEFKWVENIGEVIIDNIELYIGGSLIDRQYGEWFHIWNELTLSIDKRALYNKMIGNTLDMNNPQKANNGVYPSRSIVSGVPSIKGRQLIIPLNFWFNNNTGLALPLIGIQYQDVEIHIELRKLIDLYQVIDNTSMISKYVKPKNLEHTFTNFIAGDVTGINSTALEINPYIEANYVFLDEIERKEFALNSMDYLIEQVIKVDEYYLKNRYNIVNLQLHNPVKELIWVIKKNNNTDSNDWFNFNDNLLTENILKKARILFNGLDRVEEKSSEYFNLIQAYQHHGQTKDGIYLYSFSLKPHMFQPTGACNMSIINKIQLYLDINTPVIDDYNYDVTIYSVSYNYLRVLGGRANIAFHL